MHAECDSPHAIYSTIWWAKAIIYIGLSIPMLSPCPSLPPCPLPQLYTFPFVVKARQWLDPLAIAFILTLGLSWILFTLCSGFSGGNKTSYGVLTVLLLAIIWCNLGLNPSPSDPLLPIPHDHTSYCLVNNMQYECPQQILTGSPIS